MLVLTRKSNESITIGSDIQVTVLKIDKDQVRLGIKAPPKVPVHRKEIFEEIQRENRRAAALRGAPAASQRAGLREIGDLLSRPRK